MNNKLFKIPRLSADTMWSIKMHFTENNDPIGYNLVELTKLEHFFFN